MPRVSAAHVEARKSQILDAARICFLRKGFHESSMQDIFRESGLSSGAVYLYFKSKDELITTLVTDRLGEVARGLEHVLVEDELPPLEHLPEKVIRPFLQVNGGMEFERLAVQIFSESQHNPAITALTDQVLNMMLGLLIRAVDAYKTHGVIDPAIPSESVARVIASVVHGFIVQRSLDPELDPDVFLAGLQAFRANFPR
jgi:AcrR family transcriptional regulator